jgi:K+-transporting ATPase KdpF subunit
VIPIEPVAALLSLLVGAYLLFALLRPEKF